MNDRSLSEKVALVTGAGSGIGAATAVLLAEAGADLCLVDIDAAGMAETARASGQFGRSVLPFAADIASATDARAAVDAALNAFKRIDVCVNVAGVSGRAPLVEMSDEEWERVLRVNLYGTFFFCREVGRAMVARAAGNIINVSSSRAVQGLANGAHYAASKAAVIALTYSLAEELRPHGIRVNVVVPRATDTPLYRRVHSAEARERQRIQGDVSSAESVARLIRFMASEDSEPLSGQAVGWVHTYR